MWYKLVNPPLSGRIKIRTKLITNLMLPSTLWAGKMTFIFLSSWSKCVIPRMRLTLFHSSDGKLTQISYVMTTSATGIKSIGILLIPALTAASVIVLYSTMRVLAKGWDPWHISATYASPILYAMTVLRNWPNARFAKGLNQVLNLQALLF
jgi:hypothetical protein